MSNSCQGCPNRVLGCHDTCEKYKSFRKDLDEYNKVARQKQQEANWDIPHRPRRNHL